MADFVPGVSFHYPEELIRACVEVAAEHFDPALLSPDAVVGTLEEDEVVKLLGWDEAQSAWNLAYADGRRRTSSTVLDPYFAKRIYRFIVTGTLTQYPWETAALGVEILQPLSEAVARRLQEGGSRG